MTFDRHLSKNDVNNYLSSETVERLYKLKNIVFYLDSIFKKDNNTIFDGIDIVKEPEIYYDSNLQLLKKNEYLNSGNYGLIFKGIVNSDITYITKIIPYEQCFKIEEKNSDYTSLDIDNITRPENIDYIMPIYISKLLNLYYNNNLLTKPIISPHLSIPIYSYRYHWQDIFKYINTCKNITSSTFYKEIIVNMAPYTSAIAANVAIIASSYVNNKIIKLEKYLQSLESIHKENNDSNTNYQNNLYRILNNNLKNTTLVAYISEHAVHQDLGKWLVRHKPNNIEIKILNFQVMYTLACIQSLDPTFRHNDLSYSNILIQNNVIKSGDSDCYNHYSFFDIDFLIPNVSFSTRITDFDFSNSSKYNNSKVCYKTKSTVIEPYDDVGITTLPNLQYDLHYFYKTFGDIYNKKYDTHFNRIYNIWCPKMLYDKNTEYIESRYSLRLSKYSQIDNNLSNVLCDLQNEILPINWKTIDNHSHKRPQYLNTKTNEISSYRPVNPNTSIKYSDLSAEYLLLNTDLFQDYICSSKDLQTYYKKGKIINTYKITR